MRALVFTEPSHVVLRDEPEPTPADDEVVITVASAGICGSELHGFRSVGMRKPPLIMGHEFAGTTPDGRRVAVNPLLCCGTCSACLAGREQICSDRQLLGVHRAGGFAERVAVPVSAVHELPPTLGWTEAAVVEPLANAVHAWGLLTPAPKRVAIVGCGAIGLVCLVVARHHGCAEVVAVDPSPQRRAVAASLGARAVEGFHAGDANSFEAVIDAVGLPDTRSMSVQVVQPGGTACWLGLASSEAGFDGNDLVRNEKRVQGSFAYTDAEFAQALELAMQVDLTWATPIPFEDADTTFGQLADGRTDLAKAVLRTGVV
jgi:threonine dehydrogenase-like Zn-dependent dehydrogenase